MTEEKRYGMVSLEDEIRKVRDMALGNVKQPEPLPPEKLEETLKGMLAEGDAYGSFKTTDMVKTKKSRNNMMGGKASVIMKIINGKLEFTVQHDNGKTEKVDAKGLAKIVA